MRDLLASAAARRPDALAVEDERDRWSYRELSAHAEAVASTLRDAGAAPGRICVVEGGPTLPLIAALHGAIRTGACVAPLHAGLTASERARAIGGLRPAVRIGPEGRIESVDAGPAAVRVPESCAAVLWTSGTTGTPRGVLLTEAGLRASAEAARKRLGLGPEDRWYASLSPAHVGGLALVTRAALLGSALVVRSDGSAATLADLLDRGAVTHASLVPTMLHRLLAHRGERPAPSTAALLLVGGARTPPDLARRASSQGWAIALTYGLTEATSQVATASPAEVARDPSPALRPLDGVEVMIAPNGEILVRGPTVSPGTLAGGPLTDGDGWLHTGDLGELDDRGHLRVTGRGTDRIVTGGVTVDAHEVADALRTHPEVEDAFAFGVPDAEWGERVVALVEPRTGREPVADAILEWLRPRVSGPKRPKTLVVVPHLPRNANRKVDRAAARGLLDD